MRTSKESAAFPCLKGMSKITNQRHAIPKAGSIRYREPVPRFGDKSGTPTARGRYALFHKRRHRRNLVAQSFLVPDITPSLGQPESVARAAIEAGLSMPLWEVAVRVAVELTVIFIIARAVIATVDRVGKRASTVIDREKQKEDNFQIARIVLDAGIEAAQRPIKLLVPAVAALLSLRTITLGLQIFVENEMFREQHRFSKHALLVVFKALGRLDQFATEFWQLGVILLTLWLLLDWKDRLVKIVTDLEKKSKEAGGEGFGLNRIVLPMSGLASWGLILVGGLTSLNVFGINIQPLLAVGGISGLAIGLGAQTVIANAIAGINLFLTRPFVVGDRIELKTTAGGTVMTGVVETIDPMRTVLRTDDTVPVAVPNKAITDMIVSNESRIGRAQVMTEFKDPRQYTTTFKIKNADFHKLPEVLSDIIDYLKTARGVDKVLPMSAKLQSLGDSSVTVGVMAHTTATQSREFQNFNHDTLMAVADIMKKRGAGFA